MFWKKKSKQDSDKIPGIEYPKIGERWVRIARDNNPWGEGDFVEIFDVINNWVRYGRTYAGRYPTQVCFSIDRRLPLEYFFSLYQRYIPLPSEKTEENK